MKGNTMNSNENNAIESATTEAAAAPVVAKPKLSYMEKITARAQMLAARITTDTEEYNQIVAQINNVEALKNLNTGSKVTFKAGRKFADRDTTRIVEAVIVGAAAQEDGSMLYKVSFGEGFDAEVAVINAGQILTVVA